MKFLLLSAVLLYCHHTFAAEPKPFTTCARKWVKIGCFHDSLSPRPLPDLLLNDRDVYSPANDGHVLDWYKWPESQHSLACRCAEKARAKGYKVFGLQFYGECWGGPNGELLFSKDGPSNNCIQQLTKPHGCVKQDPFTECVGGESTNFIYRLVDNTPEPQSPDVDGGYSKWSDWSACSKSCGVGEKIRERTCSNPTPKGNGKTCEELGPAVEVAQCHLITCPSRCERAMDVGIVVDTSSSVGRTNFKKVKKFLENLVEEFTISAAKTHVGVVRYNHYAKLMWDFSKKENYDKASLKQSIDKIDFKPGGTRTDLGMEMAGNLMFKGAGARPFVPHVLLVLTDGRTDPKRSKPYHEVLAKLKKQVPGVKIIAIGVGRVFQMKENKELEHIADNKKENVFKMDSFEDLIKRLNEIVKAFCQTRL